VITDEYLKYLPACLFLQSGYNAGYTAGVKVQVNVGVDMTGSSSSSRPQAQPQQQHTRLSSSSSITTNSNSTSSNQESQQVRVCEAVLNLCSCCQAPTAPSATCWGAAQQYTILAIH
jgi:hypothetical protein